MYAEQYTVLFFRLVHLTDFLRIIQLKLLKVEQSKFPMDFNILSISVCLSAYFFIFLFNIQLPHLFNVLNLLSLSITIPHKKRDEKVQCNPFYKRTTYDQDGHVRVTAVCISKREKQKWRQTSGISINKNNKLEMYFP